MEIKQLFLETLECVDSRVDFGVVRLNFFIIFMSRNNEILGKCTLYWIDFEICASSFDVVIQMTNASEKECKSWRNLRDSGFDKN